MHAAAALSRPTFAIFGPTRPVETGPHLPGGWVFSGRCPRRPCFCFDCKTRLCMKSIVPHDVYAAIRGGEVRSAGCDVYRTATDAQGIFSLCPVVEQGTPYFNHAGAALTCRCIDEFSIFDFHGRDEEIAMVKEETLRFADALRAMARLLDEYETTGSPDCVRAFERTRAGLAAFSGIGTFWTALLNIALNGVPLLDPVAGVYESRDLCRSTADALTKALTVFP